MQRSSKGQQQGQQLGSVDCVRRSIDVVCGERSVASMRSGVIAGACGDGMESEEGRPACAAAHSPVREGMLSESQRVRCCLWLLRDRMQALPIFVCYAMVLAFGP